MDLVKARAHAEHAARYGARGNEHKRNAHARRARHYYRAHFGSLGAETCRACRGPESPLVRLGCKCRDVAHVACLAKQAHDSQVKEFEKSTMGFVSQWRECPKCKDAFTGDMRLGLDDAWWKSVGEGQIKGGILDAATENRIECDMIRGKYAEAESVARGLIKKYRSVDPSAVDGPATQRRMLFTIALLASCVRQLGRPDEAIELLQNMIEELDRRGIPRESVERLGAMAQLANAYAQKDDFAQSGSLLKEVVRLSPREPSRMSLTWRLSHATVLDAMGQKHEAAETWGSIAEVSRRLFGEHDVLHLRANLMLAATNLELAGHGDAARIQELRGAIGAMRGFEDVDTVRARVAFAHALFLGGDELESVEIMSAAVPTLRKLRGPLSRETLIAETSHGVALFSCGRLAEAEAMLRKTHATALKALGEHDVATKDAQAAHAESMKRLNTARLRVGVRVEVHGLIQKTSLNGRKGTITENGGDVYRVELDAEGDKKEARLHFELKNLLARCQFRDCTSNVPPSFECGRCKQAWYCCRECQRKHWPRHKLLCTIAQSQSGQ
jgi:tetratricopeptide (TPR) repeat protein